MHLFYAVLSLVTCGFAVHTWKWADCSDPRTRVLTILNFDLTPKPLSLPGNYSVSLVGTFTRRLPPYIHYTVNIVIYKKYLGHWHAVPCSRRVGSCVYDDPCEIIQMFLHNNTCPQSFMDNGLPCSCPFNPITLDVKDAFVTVKTISSQWTLHEMISLRNH